MLHGAACGNGVRSKNTQLLA